MENRSVMVVFREGNGKWWKSWDGARHYTDTLNFKNSVWQCINQLGRLGHEVGIVYLDQEAYGVQDNEVSFRPASNLDIEVLVNSTDIYNEINWDEIPMALHNKVFDVTGASTQLKRVGFDMNSINQFLMWLEVKMFGIEAPSPERN